MAGSQAATRNATSACNSCVQRESLLRLNEGQHDANGLDAILFTDHAAPKSNLAAKHHGLGSRYAIVYFFSIAKNLSTTAMPNPQSGCPGLENSGRAKMGKLSISHDVDMFRLTNHDVASRLGSQIDQAVCGRTRIATVYRLDPCSSECRVARLYEQGWGGRLRRRW